MRYLFPSVSYLKQVCKTEAWLKLLLYPYRPISISVKSASLLFRSTSAQSKPNALQKDRNTCGVLLVGIGIFPYKIAADKNFYIDLLNALETYSINPIIFSLNDLKGISSLSTKSRKIPIYNCKRPFHFRSKKYHVYKQKKHFYHHRHKATREVLEKTISLLYWAPKLRKIVKKHNIQTLHFIDNFGPIMGMLKKIIKVPVIAATAANYEPRGASYDSFLRYSYGRIDKVAVLSKAYQKKLVSLGVNQERLELVKWGVRLDNKRTTSSRASIRQKYGVTNNKKLVLWSGFIQQIQKNDFIKTVEMLRKMKTHLAPIAKFVFAFKPEVYSAEFNDYADEGYIDVLGGVDNFYELLASADLLLSPIDNLESSVSPPLTWLEAMHFGTPVATTAASGVHDVISNGVNGFVAQDYLDLEKRLKEIIISVPNETISSDANKFVANNYGIDKIAKNYYRFWSSSQNV